VEIHQAIDLFQRIFLAEFFLRLGAFDIILDFGQRAQFSTRNNRPHRMLPQEKQQDDREPKVSGKNEKIQRRNMQ
jgi:hypothetical protein